jgi:probable FeS assembly SUF system protein SufT
MNMRDNSEQVTLSRDVDAALVPVGDRVKLQAGQQATITQALGGSYTVVVGGNMFRIDAKDADALGEIPVAQAAKAGSDVPGTHEEVDLAVWEQLRTCYDPEIPVSIVELGLVYECNVLPAAGEEGWRVQIRMTLTAPGCGMGDYLARDVEQKLLEIPEVKQVEVELVWDPPWTRDLMSEAARLQLGMF